MPSIIRCLMAVLTRMIKFWLGKSCYDLKLYDYYGIFPQQIGNEYKDGFYQRKLTPKEKIQLKKIIAETGAESAKDLGKVMGAASKALAGKSDGKSISEMAKKLLS